MNNKPIAIVAIVVGILLLVVGAIYATQAPSDLPSFFPGHGAAHTGHHMKHAIAAIVVGVLCFVFAWFVSGSKSSSAPEETMPNSSSEE